MPASWVTSTGCSSAVRQVLNTFDGENATVNIRARLTEPLTNPNIAQNITIFAKDLDGSDLAAVQGADEYTHQVALNQFNTTTMTTVSIPLSQFMRNTADAVRIHERGGRNAYNFNLYEFGLGVLPGGGLLRDGAGIPGNSHCGGAVCRATTTTTAKLTRPTMSMWRNNDARPSAAILAG